MDASGEHAAETSAVAVTAEASTSVSRTALRWKKLRAATHVLLLFRKRVNNVMSKQQSRHGKRLGAAFWVAPAAATTTGSTNGSSSSNSGSGGHGHGPGAALTGASSWYQRKMKLFQRMLTKSVQNRSDADIKLLAEFIRHSRFFTNLSFASVDALARVLRFETYLDGEAVFQQGDAIHDCSSRYLVLQGSLFVYRNQQYQQRAREGEDYIEWFQRNNPSLNQQDVKYGECIDTCNVGDTCGDDAITGPIFRDCTVIAQVKTVVACVTQAEFKRVARFNIESDVQLLEDVLHYFQAMQRRPAADHRLSITNVSQSRHNSVARIDTKVTRLLARFLGRYQCFRVLPPITYVDLVSKFQVLVLKSGEMLCSAADEKPRMFLVLTGKLCVHTTPSTEETRPTHYTESNYVFDSGVGALRAPRQDKHTTADKVRSPTACEMFNGVPVGSESSTHICTLVAGDSFGELAITERHAFQGATLFNPTTSNALCTVVALTREDYQAALMRHLDTTALSLEGAVSILTRVLPQDRTDEHVASLRRFLTHQQHTKLLFRQLPTYLLTAICLHAGVETHDVSDEEITTFIQREEDEVDCVRIIISGYVGVFKNKERSIAALSGGIDEEFDSKPRVTERNKDRDSDDEDDSNSDSDSDSEDERIAVTKPPVPVVPPRAVLRRHQSRLIRGGTRFIDTHTFHATGHLRRGSVTTGAPNDPAHMPQQQRRRPSNTGDALNIRRGSVSPSSESLQIRRGSVSPSPESLQLRRPSHSFTTSLANEHGMSPQGMEHDPFDTGAFNPIDAEHALDPVSILPSGTAFGHLQIFTKSRSPYSYAAYTAATTTATLTSNSTEVAQLTARASRVIMEAPLLNHVVVLSLPARFAKIYLAAIDEHLVYNPVRVLKRISRARDTAVRAGTPPSSVFRGLHIGGIVGQSPSFLGVPRSSIDTLLANIEIVHLPAKRVLYEVGDVFSSQAFVVLSGTVRIFAYSKPSKARPKRDGNKEKRASQQLVRRLSARRSVLDGNDVMNVAATRFSRIAGDSIFLSDYDRTTELVVGDCFGRFGHLLEHADPALSHIRAARGSEEFERVMRRGSNITPVQLPAAYTESAVTMTECHIGILQSTHKLPLLEAKEKRELVGLILARQELEAFGDQGRQANINSLGTSFKVLERLGLSSRLSSMQRVHVANSLRYCKMKYGDVVYRQGEEARALYLILSGKVRLVTRMQERRKQCAALPQLQQHDDWYVDIMDEDMFGEEAFFDTCGSGRLATATVTSEVGETELIFLARDEFDRALALDHHSSLDHDLAISPGLLGLHHHRMSSKERWRIAIYQVIQRRTQRSKWHSVISKARQHRIDLMFDLIKDAPVFQDVARAHVVRLCSGAVLQTVAPDTIIYSKGDNDLHSAFLVLQGGVMLYQLCTTTLPTSQTATHGNTASVEPSTVKVTIQYLREGGLFGEFEYFHETSKRCITAAAGNHGAKIILFPREDFLANWPFKAQLESKLQVLGDHLARVCRLDNEQLCSLYYAAQCRSFKRNEGEMVSGTPDMTGFLHIIESGYCVVHDAVSLQQKSKRPSIQALSPIKVTLDTRVASLGPGSIVFNDKADYDPLTGASEEVNTDTEYTVVDSPLVSALSFQLFAAKHSTPLYRHQELLPTVILGRHGLTLLRETIALERQWRTQAAVHTGRFLAMSVAKNAPDKLAKLGSPEMVRTPRKPVTRRPDTINFLQQRQLFDFAQSHNHQRSPVSSPPRSSESTGAMPSSPSMSPSTRSFMGDYNADIGAPPSVLLPVVALPSTCRSPRREVTSRKVDAVSPADQLREEKSLLMELSNTITHHQVRKLAQEQQQRRRHGRPPTKQVENGYNFVDEHAVVPVRALHAEHERKKASLCRRLLHVRQPDDI